MSASVLGRLRSAIVVLFVGATVLVVWNGFDAQARAENMMAAKAPTPEPGNSALRDLGVTSDPYAGLAEQEEHDRMRRSAIAHGWERYGKHGCYALVSCRFGRDRISCAANCSAPFRPILDNHRLLENGLLGRDGLVRI